MKQKDRINNRILEYIERNDLVPAGSRVCVGFSGGADSLFLLYFLWKNQEKLKISLAACHVNHQMRGAESDGDQEFARAFCRERGIPFYAFSYPVEELAAAWHMGCEEAGRKVRREAFGICLEKYGMTCIALAHHRNDQAETMLFHLARGSSLRGMAGIRPATVFQYSTFSFGSSGSDSEKSKGMQEGRMIHPLLCLDRDEIEACLREADLSWRTDHTNLETDFSRNKIRHKVMSYLQEEINRQAVSHLAQAAEQAGRADDFLRSEAAARAGKYVTGATGEFLEAGDSYTSERYKDIGKNTYSEKNGLGDSGEKIGTEKDSSADKSTKKDSSADKSTKKDMSVDKSTKKDMSVDKSTKKDMSVDKSTEKVSSVDKSGKLFYGKSQYIDISDRILEEPEIMQDYILMDLLSRMAGSRKDIDSGHVKRLRALFSMEAGREISLPYGLRAVRRYGEIRLGLNSRINRREKNDKMSGLVNSNPKNTALSRQDWTQPITGQGIFACGPFQLDVALEESALLDQIPQKKYTKWLDYDNIKNGLVVRKRRPGDYFLLDGEGHRKKLKEFFVEQKIPREERDDIYLLTSGSRVFWIIGYRISNDAKVTDQTQHVVRLNFRRKEK